ncbi:hypothetical protein TRVL_09125 [Trypanosoma vivax]|nr:hypothetical protein TRVL_09125 [Trypanosoma vivax]
MTHRKKGRWCGHGRSKQAPHVLIRPVRSAFALRRAKQSNDDLRNAPRVASQALRTTTALQQPPDVSQRSYQRRHILQRCVHLPCKHARALTTATPQATEQTSNNTQPRALLPPLSLRAQLLSALPPQSVLLIDTRLSSLASHVARRAPSAQRHRTASHASLHHIGNVPPRAQLLPQHRSAAWLVRDLSHLRFPPPPSATQMDGKRDGHGGPWSPSLRVISAYPRNVSRVRAARPSNTNRRAPGNGSGAVKHSPQLRMNSKPRVGRTKLQSAWRCCRARFTS